MTNQGLKTLFLQAPSFEGFDGGAGSRYQAKGEVRSFWYPTWLAQPAALVPRSLLLDAPADGLTVDETRRIARSYELVIIHKKGLRTEIARRFTANCRDLGIVIHGTFILGLPGETTQTIAKTIEFAKEINPHTIQVSLVAPYPGTSLYKEAVTKGWLQENNSQNLANEQGVQLAVISYPHLSKEQIFPSMELFYREFYFRPGKIWEIVREMLVSPQMMRRRLREGVEFFRCLHAREA